MSDYLHGYHQSVLGGHRNRTAANSAPHLLPHLRPGQRLLDVGAGAGTITCDLATAVAPGEVVAMEVSEQALELSLAEAARRGIPLTGAVGDVHALPFDDDGFDVAHAHQVLQHVSDPVAALREMARVVRPGGVVAVRESDYGMFAWHPASAGLEEWNDLYHRAARALGAEPDAGRHLAAWAAAAGLQATFSGTTWAYAGAQATDWAEMWVQRVTESGFAATARMVGATDADLARLSEAWHAWGAQPSAFMLVPSIEMVAMVV